MKIVICGSLSFADKMLAISKELKSMGHNPVLPVDIFEALTDSSLKNNVKHCIEKDIIRDHLLKIQHSDAILVLNYEKKGVPGYIGGSTLIEIGFAHFWNKKIYFLNPIPDMSYTVELKAMQPIVLNDEFERF
ncbi:MAG: hypothetical protein ACOWW1_06365 [archaeon]